jgi:hypothetical protein
MLSQERETELAMTFLTLEGHIREIIDGDLAPEQKLAAIEAFLDAVEDPPEEDDHEK